MRNDQTLSPPSISVVTTTDPVAGFLSELLDQLSKLALERGELFEVVVVDDLKLWRDSSQISMADHPGLVVKTIWYPEHRGQLPAMLSGVAQAGCPTVFTTDPDMFACVRELPAMLDQFDETTALLHGVRPHRLDAGLIRRFGSRLTNWLVSVITGLRITDLGSPIALLRPAQLMPLLDEAGHPANPRLYLYALLGSAVRFYSLKQGAPPGSPSQYRLFTLIKLFCQLFRESMEVRQKLKAITTNTRQ